MLRELLACYESDPAPAVRAEALTVLTLLDPDPVAAHRRLRPALTDPAPAVRAAAALPHEHSPSDLGVLIGTISRWLPAVRHPDPALADSLLPHARADFLTGRKAQTVLGQLGDPRLLSDVPDPSPEALAALAVRTRLPEHQCLALRHPDGTGMDAASTPTSPPRKPVPICPTSPVCCGDTPPGPSSTASPTGRSGTPSSSSTWKPSRAPATTTASPSPRRSPPPSSAAIQAPPCGCWSTGSRTARDSWRRRADWVKPPLPC
ncbi:hypothetical protein ACFZDG_34265 [Kitasatospora xanthocidica]|uniref:hypothetical protein n=1 Tax=Kitasatospora xanthocidica TaxID=83382 RepID=UPI0036DFE632